MPNEYSIDEIRQRLIPIFKSSSIYRAILFGSYSKGTASTNSDIDIVIDSRGEIRGIDFYGVLDEIVEALNMDVDLFEASEIRAGTPIHDEIFQQGVILYER